MLEEFMNVMTDNNLDTIDEELRKAEVENLIDGLEMFSTDPKMLTNAYTDILCNDNVVYLLTRISQHSIFREHFPEFYEKNENGESVINCQQNSPYHRYGVFRHILYTIEYVGRDNLNYSKQDLKLLKWTMFLHDIGKPAAKITNSEGRDSFSGHEEISVEMATNILERFYFTEQEKKIILTLIKYHDKYLNEGELTNDNLSFLAQELENRKDLFDMLIEVKTADNKAKSVAVYNKFMVVIPKYIEFEDKYFSSTKDKDDLFKEEDIFSFDLDDDADDANGEDEELIVNDRETQDKVEIKDTKEIVITNIKQENKIEKEELSKEGFDEIYNSILNGIDIQYNYMPIVSIRESKVYGYNIDARMQNGYEFHDIYKKAKEEGKYDKIRQLLMLNFAETGVEIKKNKDLLLAINMDIFSFSKYNNKNRIYDIADKDNILFLFENYDASNAVDINKICKDIKRNHGYIGFANFQDSKFTIKELSNLEIDFIEYKYDGNDERINELVKYCLSNTTKVWVTNVEDKKIALKMKKMDVEFISGGNLFGITERPEITDYEVEKIISSI